MINFKSEYEQGFPIHIAMEDLDKNYDMVIQLLKAMPDVRLMPRNRTQEKMIGGGACVDRFKFGSKIMLILLTCIECKEDLNSIEDRYTIEFFIFRYMD